MHFLVVDSGGLYVELAELLSAGGKNKVSYWTDYWDTDFKTYAPGLNFEHLKKEKYLNRVAKQADCIVNPDVTANDLICILRELYPKKSIFGSGEGAILEDNRPALKKIIQKLGLPTQKYEVVRGLTKLKEYIKKNPDKYVKLDIFRSKDGGFDSFYAQDFDKCEEIFKEIDVTFGAFSEELDFTVEENIKSEVEAGFDGFYSAGIGYGDNCLVGYEYGKNCYLAKVFNYKDVPIPLKETMDRLRPVLDQVDWRGAISTEEKIISPIKHYLLDICARFLNPSEAVYSFVKNFPELIYNVGAKKNFKMEIPFKYLASAPIKCPHAEKHWVRLNVAPQDRKNIKFKCVGQVGKAYYGVPGEDNAAVSLGYGNTPDEAINMCIKYSEKISGYTISNVMVRDFMKIKDEIKKGSKIGINFL